MSRLIRGLDAIAKSLPDYMAGAAGAVQATARSQYAAGRGPNDQAWKPNVDGTVSARLQELAAKVTFTGTLQGIVQSVDPKLEFHQSTRPTAPDGDTLPLKWEKAADDYLKGRIDQELK